MKIQDSNMREEHRPLEEKFREIAAQKGKLPVFAERIVRQDSLVGFINTVIFETTFAKIN
jgi:hypothetical protein